MSIPPLVCSTPPPPDQCEDDKDPEDFDIQYSLSQEDDDNDFNYGDYSTYSRFNSSISTNKIPEPMKETADNIDASTDKREINTETKHLTDIPGTSIAIDKKQFEDDVNIEDLGLHLEETKISPTNIHDEVHDTVSEETHEANTIVVQTDTIAFETHEDDSEKNDNFIRKESPSTESPVCISQEDTVENKSEDSNSIQIIDNNLENDHEDVCISEKDKDIIVETINKVDDDDFGDFDDFHFVSSSNNETTSVFDNCDDPWGADSKESESTDFGDFKANFDESVTNFDTPSKDPPSTEISAKAVESVEVRNDNYDDDDDFGDFDDFKSSAVVDKPVDVAEDILASHEAILNLHSPDEGQLINNINKVVYTIFEEDIEEPVEEISSKLETLLCETWGHLIDVDVRQPYIVNWNNSLAQKTLLKALCIDSRNILFGPKWSSNMPKYATNLSSAPLQPQKQTTPSAAAPDTTPDAIKPSTWSDPFTSDGQESACSPETEGATTAAEIRPSDLDIFEVSVPSKAEKIYSSTLNVQPIRQISLPDTHIFTPTDSETPRSKTIHYDPGPSVLIPQPLENKIPPEKFNTQNIDDSNLDNDDDYSDFQDFKASKPEPTVSDSKQPVNFNTDETPHIPSSTSSSLPLQTQILQPIKVELMMPSLNWPDPGEVKETFEDFTDFVSNSTWASNDETPTTPSQMVHNNPLVDDIKENPNVTKEVAGDEVVSKDNDDFDDDFDTFQSAVPLPKTTLKSLSNNSSVNSTTASLQTQNVDFDQAFPKNETNKSDSISFTPVIATHESLTQNQIPFVRNTLDLAHKSTDLTVKTASPQTSQPTYAPAPSMLQPAVVNSFTTPSQQKSGQILQPLSLQSYTQINWPNPGINLQDLSSFNPVETFHSLKSDLSSNSQSKNASPIHQKAVTNNSADDDIWGEFVSSKPKAQSSVPKKPPPVVDDDEWSDFVSSPSVKPQNGLNTISLNVHTNLSLQKPGNQTKFSVDNNQLPLDIPALNYITPKSSNHVSYNDTHFQNL